MARSIDAKTGSHRGDGQGPVRNTSDRDRFGPWAV